MVLALAEFGVKCPELTVSSNNVKSSVMAVIFSTLWLAFARAGFLGGLFITFTGKGSGCDANSSWFSTMALVL